MGKKDKKSKDAEQKARVAAKQSKKAAQKERKGKVKAGDDSDADDDDLDAVLEEYARKVSDIGTWVEIILQALHSHSRCRQQAQFLKVTEEVSEPPSPRSSATLIASPSSNKELFLFGGELFNGSVATFYNDLFIYHIEKDEWRKVTSPNAPLPRSGHAWCRGGNTGGVYLFGGEFSSPKQGTFYHYNDFWRLEPSTREWARLETKSKSPPARSGHRMTYYKNYILLFGGFQDTSQQTKYLQDLWIYDCQRFEWYSPSLPQKPDARSSFSFLPHEKGAVICGGYSRVKKVATTSVKKGKSASQGSRSILTPVVHQDAWFLRVESPASDASASNPPTVRWERRKPPINSPKPPRAGATMAYHIGRGISFGGVHDVEQSEEGIESQFFDDLFAWNIERNRCFQVTLRRPKMNQKKPTDSRGSGKRGRQKADEEDLLRNLAMLEAKDSESGTDLPMELADDSDNDRDTKPMKPVLMTFPYPRFNGQLAVQGDILYIYGGTFERGDREFTFDEMWSIDLGKLNGVHEIFKREPDNWLEAEDEGSDSQSGEDDESDGDEDEDESMADTVFPLEAGNPEQVPGTPASEVTMTDVDDQLEALVPDTRPYPRPFESLREFYVRTSNAWQEILLAQSRERGSLEPQSIKELRKTAFEMAETKWWDCREDITALEDEQEEAGIGEVVNIQDRSLEGGIQVKRR